MATKDIQIIVRALDQASWPIKKMGNEMQDFVQRNQTNFKKMAAVWTAAFAWIAAWVNKATQAAARDEGTWNKFATVFGEGTEEMNQFVNDLRTRMPVATGTIQRMAADIQDLLVPMGLSRELWAEMTQGFLEVSNAIGAFNDVDPSQVLQAIQSGLAGSAEPLRSFWVNANIVALEARALEMWLLQAGETFAKLEPEVANQIKAQALLAQVTANSSDAINGFEDNADSLLFRQMELSASIEDLTWTLGKAFIPIIDEVVKSITPVVKTASEWATENQELFKNIVMGAWIVTGLIAVLWTLGLAILPIIAGIKSLSLIVVGATAAFKALWITIWLLSWPIGLIVAAIWVLSLAFYTDFGWIRTFVTEVFDNIIEKVKVFIGIMHQIIDFIMPWLSSAFNTTMSFISDISEKTVNFVSWIFEGLRKTIEWVIDFAKSAYNTASKIGSTIRDTASNIWGAVSWAVWNITWARAFWWPVQAGKPYLVWERWPEIFTPWSSGMIRTGWNSWATININMWGVTVQNEADENRLIDKLKRTLEREARYYNLGIS